MLIDRRNQIRVSGEFPLSWRVNSLGGGAEGSVSPGDEGVGAQLRVVERELNVMLARLSGHSPEVATVLERLNHKVDLVSQLVRERMPPSMLCSLDLSQTGIGFDWPSEVQPGSRLLVNVLLPTSIEAVELAVVVLACSPHGGACRVHCRFEAGQRHSLEKISEYIDWMQRPAEAHGFGA